MTTSRSVSSWSLLARAPPWSGAVEAADKVRVVATIPDLKSLTEAVGGDLVDVESLTRGTQNFHEAEVRPSMMLKLRRADLLVENGARARRLGRRGRAGRQQRRHRPRRPRAHRDLARASPCWRCRATRVDRSMGDVHPLGNPHFSLDPGLAPIITQNILDGLARVAPAAPRGLRAQPARRSWPGSTSRWPAGRSTMEPRARARKVVVYHPDFIYFLTRFGLVQVGDASRTGRASRPRRSTWSTSSAR